MNDTDISLIHRLDAIEAAAYRDLFAAAPPPLASALGLHTREIAGATLLIAPGIPTSMFNRVIGLGNSQPATDRDIDAIADAYRATGIKSWWIHVSPGAAADSLTRTLLARGFTLPSRKAWAKVWRDAATPAPVDTGVVVREIRGGEELALGETLCTAFEMPGAWAPWFAALSARPRWRTVAAFDGPRLVGGGLLFMQDRLGWLGAGGVRPEARRQHAHRALMTLRIRLAIEAGCNGITTETGEAIGDEPNPSLHNMFACGFQKVSSRANYAAPAA